MPKPIVCLFASFFIIHNSFFILASDPASPGSCAAASWPQLQNGPQRHGCASESITPPYAEVWSHSVAPDRIFPATQAIIADGRLFVGTKGGAMYAFDAKTGKVLWTFQAGGPILHTAGADGGKVFFGSLDGCVYGIDAAAGTEAWRTRCEPRAGFSSGVLLAEGNVYLGSRAGRMFCLRGEDGTIRWTAECGGPVFQAASFDNPSVHSAGSGTSSGSGHRALVYVGSEDMRVSAFNAADGELAWRSDKLYGYTMKNYWSVAYKGYVIVRTSVAQNRATSPPDEHNAPFAWGGDALFEKYGDALGRGELPDDFIAAQKANIEYFEEHPEMRDLYFLDARTGKQRGGVAHWWGGSMTGPVPPPVVWRDRLITPVTFNGSRWAALDVESGLIDQMLFDSTNPKYGGGNPDETMGLSVAGDTVFAMHFQESNAQFTGSFDMRTRRWTQINPVRMRTAFFHNAQGGGTNPAAIADGMFYRIVFHRVIARRGAGKEEQ